MACASNCNLEYLLTQFRAADAPGSPLSDQSAGEIVADFASSSCQADVSTDCFLLCTSGQHLVLGYAGTDYIIVHTDPDSAGIGHGDGQFDDGNTGSRSLDDNRGTGLCDVDAGGPGIAIRTNSVNIAAAEPGHDAVGFAWRVEGPDYGSDEREAEVKPDGGEPDTNVILGGPDNHTIAGAQEAVAAGQLVQAGEPRQGETVDTGLGGTAGTGPPEVLVNVADEITATPKDFDT